MIRLEITKRTDTNLLSSMKIHYSKPKGFVGRNICYAVYYDNVYYGHIVGGSCCLHLPNRDNFFGIERIQYNNIVNNIFYHIEKVNGKYPIRNFTSFVLKEWMNAMERDWFSKYQDKVIGFETLVELPRSDELYKKVGWKEVGVTKGYTCKRGEGKGTDDWGGKRVWDVDNLRPKLVLGYKLNSEKI